MSGGSSSHDPYYEEKKAKPKHSKFDEKGRKKPIELPVPSYKFPIKVVTLPKDLYDKMSKPRSRSGLLWYRCNGCSELYPVTTQKRVAGEKSFCSAKCLKQHRQNLFQNKPQPKDATARQAKSLREKYKDPNFRKRMKKIHKDPERNRKISEAQKRRWEGQKRERNELDDKKAAYYQSPEWKKAVQRVLKRDGYQCQACGATRKEGRRLGVHHIYPLGSWMSEGKDPNDYPDAWLACICPNCHPPTDRQKGDMKYPKRPRKRRKPTR